MVTARSGISIFFAALFGLPVANGGPGAEQAATANGANTVIKISRAPLTTAEISPFQYGQFMEYLCDLVPSMWAEKLYDGSFEGLSPYKVAFLGPRDFRENPWYPSGAVNRAEYALDRAEPVSGSVAQRIAAKDGAPCTVGISQDGIALERGKACLFSCYLRQRALNGPVLVRLHHVDKVYASCEFQPGAAWKKYQAKLVPSATDTRATLSISFRGPAVLWLDNASLMPEETVGGWRPDVVAALRDLKPGVIRFGGSTLDDANLGDFEWKDTVGDPDRRKPFRAWGGLQPTGPGLEEFVQLCRRVDAEPLICVRFSRRTPRDAADQVQYFNGAADTPMGALRARNGHPEPYRVKYWQIGNERAGKDYEAKLASFCQAMKQVDPSIKLLSSYPTAGVLRAAGQWLDYVCPHHYDIADLKGADNDLARVAGLIRMHQPGRDIRIAVTEWNTTGGDWGLRRARLWTLENALACSRYHNLLHRHADEVEIANRSNLTNSFCSGVIRTDNHRLYKTPTYHAQQLYATHAGTRPLKIEPAASVAPGIDVSATLSARDDRLILFVVNDTLSAQARTLDLSDFGEEGRNVAVWTLTDRKGAGEPDVTNSFGDPKRVSPVSRELKTTAARFDYRFPALSLTVLECPVR